VCPEHSRCHRHAPGNYSCSCDPGYIFTAKKDECVISSDHVIVTRRVIDVHNYNSSRIHIILSVDQEHLQGIMITDDHNAPFIV